MRCLFVIVTAIVLMSGCIGQKRYTRHVQRACREIDTLSSYSSTSVKFFTDSLPKFDSIAKVRRVKSHFWPFIVYWGYQEDFSCQLNPNLPVGVFNKAFCHYADSFGLAKKLKGQRVELNIKSVPASFLYTSKQDIIYVLVWAFIMGKQAILPVNDQLVFEYQVFDGERIVHQGEIRVKNYDVPFVNNVRSARGITKIYMRRYQENIKKMSMKSVLKLMDEW